MKNFGNAIHVQKLKSSNKLKVAWRCRIDSIADGAKLVMPVRPVAVLAGMIDVENVNVNLL